MSISKDNENQNEEGHDCGNPDCDMTTTTTTMSLTLASGNETIRRKQTIPEGFVGHVWRLRRISR